MSTYPSLTFLRTIVMMVAAAVYSAYAYKATIPKSGIIINKAATLPLRRQTTSRGDNVAWSLLCSAPNNSNTDGSSSSGGVPKPRIIEPSTGVSSNEGKFMMMYTCKICSGRNAHMISKVAFNCDNQGKLDMKEYGKTVEEYLISQGEAVQRLSLTPEELENFYLVDQDGKLSLVPKIAGQPDPGLTIVDTSKAQSRGFGKGSP